MDGDGVMADAWFSSIKAAAFAKVRYKAVHQIMTGHRLFPKKSKMISRMHQLAFG